ncbi:MAG TPA: Hsp20/alpha crystallin family protein [Acidimicrobiales bacterium]|nr:Hsp20/alpha crystallin family protein [Acidimicrobiales bacterium]
MRFDPIRDVERWAHQLSGGTRQALMSMDAYRQSDHWVAAFDLPGVDPGSIDVTVENNVLTVKAERSWQPQEGDQLVVSERPEGTFTRQLYLGEGLDADHISASYEAGVLTVRLPVAEQAKPRKVAITTGGGQQTLEAGAQAA